MEMERGSTLSSKFNPPIQIRSPHSDTITITIIITAFPFHLIFTVTLTFSQIDLVRLTINTFCLYPSFWHLQVLICIDSLMYIHSRWYRINRLHYRTRARTRTSHRTTTKTKTRTTLKVIVNSVQTNKNNSNEIEITKRRGRRETRREGIHVGENRKRSISIVGRRSKLHFDATTWCPFSISNSNSLSSSSVWIFSVALSLRFDSEPVQSYWSNSIQPNLATALHNIDLYLVLWPTHYRQENRKDPLLF